MALIKRPRTNVITVPYGQGIFPHVTESSYHRIKWLCGIALGIGWLLLFALLGQARAQVTQDWVARYNGPGDNHDVAQKVVTDATGNVYATGWSHNGVTFDYTTVKYDPAGIQLWTARYDSGVGDFGHALAVDASGNVYVTGRSHTSLSNLTFDIATIKYDANGNQVWVRRYDTAGRDDIGLALALDTSGSPIVTGFGHNGTNTDYLTLKYDTNGNLLWVDRYNNGGNDSARDLTVDSAGNVVVTGWSEDSGGIRDYATVKFDSGGNTQWVARYNGPGNNHDVAQKVLLDSSGNVYVTGWSHNGVTFDYATVKYDPNGTPLWVARYDNGLGDFAHALAVDAAGNVYVTGRSQTSSFNPTLDVATVKYDPNGTPLWVARYDTAGGDDMGLALVLDTSGEPIVTGLGHSGTNNDVLTIKYDVNGKLLWDKIYDNRGNDSGRDLTVDPFGNVYVTGWSEDSTGLRDYATVKYVNAASASAMTERVSVDSNGIQGNKGGCCAESGSLFPSISGNGRFVTFSSESTNLVSGDTNGIGDVFIHDRVTGVTERVSIQGNSLSATPSINGNGRYLAFYSSATNLVPGDTNMHSDIFVYDRQTKMTERISVSSNGTQGNGESFTPNISSDGRYVVFMSEASNLVPGDTNGISDIFVRDRLTGVTDRVSVTSNGTQSNGENFFVSISSDGRYVAFESYGTNLVPGDTNGTYDVFVHDRITGVTERVSVASNGAQANGASSDPSISSDGRYVVFRSDASNLVAGDTNGASDIFVRDRQTGMTERVSISTSGVQGNPSSFDPQLSSFDPSVSGDGRYVAFTSYATNLVTGDTNGGGDIFVHDRQTGITERVNIGRNGEESYGGGFSSTINADGRYIAFWSYANNLVSGDTNDVVDVFVRDRGVLP